MTDPTPPGDHQERLKRALIALKNLRLELDSLKQARHEPIAIIGMGCRFPGGGESPSEFWRFLLDGGDAITEVPASRWDVDAYYDPDRDAPGKITTRFGGFLDGIDKFDAPFFGVSPREANALDPQQRLLLEVSWQALEEAGIAPRDLANSQTGIFVGIASSDFAQILLDQGPEAINAYVGSGNAHSVAVGRLSFLLGLRGPSLALDTACSSSLVAIHLACQSLRDGESDMALAGGVNLILTPSVSINHSRAQMLAPDGRCKSFDASADGFTRSEGCGMVVLKRLSDAQRDGDPILALIRGSAVNHDGRTTGLTVPNGPSQQAVIRQALANAQVEPDAVSYIEAHGTGTALGDPIEVGALGAIFGKRAAPPLFLGSVKTNIGHAEAAAGVAGLIKTVLSLQHGELPGHLHFHTPNPLMAWETLPFALPTARTPWPASEQPRLAGVSSFGFGGTNAHVVLSDAPRALPIPPPAASPVTERSLHLLALSAKSESALRALAGRYVQHLTDHPALSLPDVAWSAHTRRSHFDHRLALVAANSDEARATLTAFLAGETRGTLVQGKPAPTPKIAFLFTGQGAQYAGMGRDLYESNQTFRAALDDCDRLLRAHLDRPLLELLFVEPSAGAEADATLNQTQYTQPALFALEYALAMLWQSWGVTPDIVIGHSVGELVAACVAGAFTLAEGLQLVAARARLMGTLPPGGAMVAALAPTSEILPLLPPHAHELSVAAFNGPENVVLSGTRAAVEQIAETLRARGITIQPLTVSHAFHSPLMDGILGEFERAASAIAYAPPRIDTVSNLTGTLATDEIATPAYWSRHIRQPVRFAEGMQTLHEQGVTLFIEIGPKPTLLGMGRRCLPDGVGHWLPSLRPGQGWLPLLHSLATLYTQGAAIAWREVDRDFARQRVPLPPTPFERQRYWPAPATPPAPADASPVVSALDHGDTERLAALLTRGGALPPEASAWLPTILSALIAQHQQEQGAALAPELFYDLRWQLKLHRASPPPPLEAGAWLLLVGADETGRNLAALLAAQGHVCFVAERGATYQRSAPHHWTLDPAAPDHLARLLQEIETPLTGIVHLWSLDSAPTETLTPDGLTEAQTWGVASVLRLTQALLRSPHTARLWLITRHAAPVAGASGPLAVARAPLWGVGKVVALEQPALWGGLVDLPPTPSAADAALLLAELQGREGEDQVALRQGQRYVARLFPTPLAPTGATRPPVSAEATYLITGGLGALGLRVAQWLVHQGARHLVLVGRRAPTTPAQHEALAALQVAGAHLTLAQADVADEAALRRVLAEIAQGGHPLRGIVHAAGVAGFEPLDQIGEETLAAVLRPKVMGGWLLHTLTSTLPLDFFIFFSSIASVWGSRGQAHYAAANSFLDALAHERRRLGLPALSVNWGPWAGGGMSDADSQGLLARTGVRAFSPEQALVAMERLLAAGVVQRTVALVEWATFKELYEARGPRPLLETIPVERVTSPQAPSSPHLLDHLRAAEPEGRLPRLVAFLQAEVARILAFEAGRLPDPRHGFFEMGMDSLMAVELKSSLSQAVGTPIPTPVIFDYPSIERLAGYLAERVLGWHDRPVDAEGTGSGDAPTLDDVAGMSESEVDASLLAELAALEAALKEV